MAVAVTNTPAASSKKTSADKGEKETKSKSTKK